MPNDFVFPWWEKKEEKWEPLPLHIQLPTTFPDELPSTRRPEEEDDADEPRVIIIEM